jgi:hypothetical protein
MKAYIVEFASNLTGKIVHVERVCASSEMLAHVEALATCPHRFTGPNIELTAKVESHKNHLPAFGYSNEYMYCEPLRRVVGMAYITDDHGGTVELDSQHLYAQDAFYGALNEGSTFFKAAVI